MDTSQIRKLLRSGSSVVLVEEGHPPLLVRELQPEEEPQEVPIASRWPKGRMTSVLENKQDQILERLNKEILALKNQIAEDEAGAEHK